MNKIMCIFLIIVKIVLLESKLFHRKTFIIHGLGSSCELIKE